VRNPTAIPSEQWQTLDRLYPSENLFHGTNTLKYIFLFFGGGGGINSLFANWAVILKNILLPEKFITAPKLREIFTRLLWFTEMQLDLLIPI